MSLRAFLSSRVVTPGAIRPAALLVEGDRILDVVASAQVPPQSEFHDFGTAAILPGLVDSHVHINDPGRANWEGFETATRAAAAGGYTLLVDMPLNCLPATTSVAALKAKRAAAQGRCRVDWMAWGGVVADNPLDLEPLANAGVPGFKCFLIHPGIDGFTMVTEPQLRAALPHVARTGMPLLVHAELPAPIDSATALLANADWSLYETYLQSRPEEAELSAIRMLPSGSRPRKPRTIMAGPPRWNDRPSRDRSLSLSTGDEASRRRKFPHRLGRHRKPLRCFSLDVHRSQPSRILTKRCRALDV